METQTVPQPMLESVSQQPDLLSRRFQKQGEKLGLDITQPIAESLTVTRQGVPGTVDILVDVRDNTSAEHAVLFTQNGSLGIGLMKPGIDSNTPILDGETIYSPDDKLPRKKTITGGEVRIKNGSLVTFSVSPEDGIGTVAAFTSFYDKSSDFEVIVSADSDPDTLKKAPKTMLKRTREAHRNPTRKAKLAARIGFAAMTVSSPNSLLDKASDALDNQAAIVEEVGESKAELYLDASAHQAATDRVAEVVEALDNKDEKTIKSQAEEFEKKYGSIDSVLLGESLEKIENAHNISEALEAANAFLGTYGVSATDKKYAAEDIAMDEGDLASLKHQLAIVLNGTAILPPNAFKEVTDLKEIHLVNRIVNDGSSPEGITTRQGNKLGLSVATRYGLDSLERFIDDGSTFTHELGHTYHDAASERPVSANNENIVRATAGFLTGRLLNRPTDPSFYGATEMTAEGSGDEERFAEDFSILMRTGIPDPNKGYVFGSRLSKQMLAVLIDIEQKLPGFSAHLTEHYKQAESRNNPLKSVTDQSLERQALLYLFGIMVYATRPNTVVKKQGKTVELYR